MRVQDDFTNCENNVPMDGQVAIVTGATAGIGFEVAKNFAKRGARVIIGSRNPVKMEKAKNAIIQSSGNTNISTRKLDFGSLKSIRRFASEIYMNEPKLNILINNIGALGLPDRQTKDKLNLMMQVNYFGAFLLTFLLFPLLRTSAPSRIVNVSSITLLLGHIDLDHMNDVGRFSSFGMYCNSKLADILFTVEMNKRIQGSGVNVYSMDPGLSKSEFFRDFNDTTLRNVFNAGMLLLGRDLDRVATMPVFLATDPRVQNSSGKHFRDCAEFYSSWFAEDAELTRRLWEKSKQLVNISTEEDWELK
ncbi:unnamed protein product [Danaus chrysippus]|uniref:(African queen) hypothetical protein n=1 Tax=Danaus chrysippus TaxID=151541 RepID=A0A8J2QN17_9NEOP|nr:unnamed protein product [Danaus chrysippus]